MSCAARLRPALALVALAGLLAAADCWPEPGAGGNHRAVSEWTAYGGEHSALYCSLAEINPTNVDLVEVAWTHRSGYFGEGSGDWRYNSLQVSPIVADARI